MVGTNVRRSVWDALWQPDAGRAGEGHEPGGGGVPIQPPSEGASQDQHAGARRRPEWINSQGADRFYREDMQWHFLLPSVGLVTGIAVLIFKHRRRRPQSVEEKAAAARAAMRSIRRSSPHPGRDAFERGRGVPDRHSAAIAENAAYGDAANFDSGGGGGGTD
ncbi:hypothetical protein [Salinispora arenicola]|uniref:hypothetical protein n=1 Tax=Salinispora arenicola TaxID=168697 RepID=UPI001E3DB086|nr:hypothetical protein [Salinispora arenicola]